VDEDKKAHGLRKAAAEAMFKDVLKGGRADSKKPEDFNAMDLSKGVKVELEHTNSRHIATEIAMDHLTESPRYYDDLKKMEAKE